MSKVSVLVVDDASFIRDLVKKGLRDHFPGIQIDEAINGRKAQQMLARQPVDLILCDWEMPELSGLELLTWCREQEALKSTPFIMVTSRGDKENVVQAIQAGVSDYIGKPFSNDQLVTKVRKALLRAGKLDALAALAPSKAPLTSALANDSLAALTGGGPSRPDHQSQRRRWPRLQRQKPPGRQSLLRSADPLPAVVVAVRANCACPPAAWPA